MPPIQVVLVCPQCVKPFTREKREVNRSRRLSRQIYCSRECYLQAPKQKMVTRSCPCGKKFDAKPRKDAARHCSASCASRFSMTEERREAQRIGGRLGAQRFVQNLAKNIEPNPDLGDNREVGV